MSLPRIFLSLAVLVTLTATATSAVIFPGPGWQATLSNDFHNVSGTVTILDADSLVVENFTFDGGGISVYFYLGATDSNPAFTSGQRIGNQLVGPAFDGTQGPIVIDLMPGQTVDGLGAISVWCEAVGVSFGSGTFAPVPEPSSALLLSLALLPALRRRRPHN